MLRSYVSRTSRATGQNQSKIASRNSSIDTKITLELDSVAIEASEKLSSPFFLFLSTQGQFLETRKIFKSLEDSYEYQYRRKAAAEFS
jgi:hypothetical protein